MLPLLIVLFVAVPLVEIFVIIQVGEAIGVLPTILLLVGDSILGSVLMRSQGRAAWRRFNAAVAERRPPTREVLDGALVIFGGALLLTPGFVSDVFGLLFLLPPTRVLVRRVVVAAAARRLFGGRRRGGPGGGAGTRGRGPGGAPYDVEGHAVEVDRERLP